MGLDPAGGNSPSYAATDDNRDSNARGNPNGFLVTPENAGCPHVGFNLATVPSVLTPAYGRKETHAAFGALAQDTSSCT